MHDTYELPDYLEEIVQGSHPSLGEPGRQLLRDFLLRYRHVFPAPGEPVTGRTSTVQHDIVTTDARPVCCGPRRLAPAGLKAKKCTFMQTEVVFLGHIVGRTGLACDPAKLEAVRNWHAPDKVKGV